MKRFYRAWWGRIVLLILMSLGTIQVLLGQSVFLISGVNLVFHEAGHVIFFVLGMFLQVLGGTVLQLLIPAFVGAVFYMRRTLFAAWFSAWWLGINIVEVGIYMADARVRRLELLGDLHDWAYLFGRTGLSSYDATIGGATEIVGTILVVLSTVLAATVLWYQRAVGHEHRIE